VVEKPVVSNRILKKIPQNVCGKFIPAQAGFNRSSILYKTKRFVKMILPLVQLIIFVAILYASWRYMHNYVQTTANALPENWVGSVGEKSGKKRIICCGDSLTLGTCSYNYVEDLVRKLPESEFEVVNAGQNSDLAWNLLHRLDEVVAAQPDYVVILSGTNDINATLSDENLDGYRRVKGIKVQPDLSWYLRTMQEIIGRLRKETSAQIACISMPMIGENSMDDVNRMAKGYALALEDLCKRENVAYLPFQEHQRAYLEDFPVTERSGYDAKRVRWQVTAGAWYKLVLKVRWETISRWHGYRTLIDGVHLNRISGKMLSDLIYNWVFASKS
jgi:lysophospholipase L1-like esterase